MPVLPVDVDVVFSVGEDRYCDDIFFVDTSPERVNAALERLQTVCGRIGLNISVGKTEWLYLHNPSAQALEECRANRCQLTNCCAKIRLGSRPIKHVSCFKYLGSMVSENGGMYEETRFRVLQATVSLNRYNGIWDSELTLRQKVRFLKTHVLPSLVYASECGNHTQKEVSMISVFLNMCRRRLLGVGKCMADGTVIRVEELKRRCRLPEPLDLLSRRRINFITKVVVQPHCMVARQMLYARMEVQPGDGTRNVSGRDRSSYVNVLTHDLGYLYSGQSAKQSFDGLMGLAHRMGLEHTQKILKALKPDEKRGGNLKLVSARPKLFFCPMGGCTAGFAEQKEVNMHVKKSHSVVAEPPVAPTVERQPIGGDGLRLPARGVTSTEGERTGDGAVVPNARAYPCPFPGCSKTYKASGWLANHLKSNHNGLAVPVDPESPCTAHVIADSGLARRATARSAMRRDPQTVVRRSVIPVSSPGDGGAGRIGPVEAVGSAVDQGEHLDVGF